MSTIIIVRNKLARVCVSIPVSILGAATERTGTSSSWGADLGLLRSMKRR